MNLRHSKVTVDLDAIRHNYTYLKKAAANRQCIAVIKADAYGHGAIQVAKALSKAPVIADAFAVATVPEAIQLRQANIQQKILVLGGFIDQQELNQAQASALDCVVHSNYQIDLLIKQNKSLNLWVKINSGMGRLGFNLAQAKTVLESLKDFTIVSLMTHFASADDVNNKKTTAQIKQITALGLNDYDWSMANSAATLGWQASHKTWVRFGIALYGINPFETDEVVAKGLLPAMSFKSQIIAIYQRQKGDTIGYASIYTCPKDMSIGVISVGYADGYPRHIDSKAYVIIKGEKAMILGRVSMDMITVDLSKLTQANIGDTVILWSQSPKVEEIASSSGTIAYELCCNVGAHAKIEYTQNL